MKNHKIIRRALALTVTFFGAVALNASPAFAENTCSSIASALGVAGNTGIHTALTAALTAVAGDGVTNGGLGNESWATIVDRDGIVCAVTFSAATRNRQWPGSRVISAQKANAAISFSLPALATGTVIPLSTANLWALTQPGGSLFGLQFSNPVNHAVAYAGLPIRYGKTGIDPDPMVGGRIGGVNVFGGGLALYSPVGTKIGGVGTSGDTACADHNVTWRLRDRLGLDFVPGGVSGTGDDNIIYDCAVDVSTGHCVSAGGFGHPTCGFGAAALNPGIVAACPAGDGITIGCP